MKTILITTGIILASIFSAQASADQMECYVDTQAYDQFTPNHCFAVIYGKRTATAVFRVVGNGSDIDSVVWSNAASSCGVSGTSCSFSIKSFKSNKAEATVLYTDGTWSKVSATASFEDGR
ncbi:hypothetical protein I6F50_13150 [Pseudoalteromonas sp. NZS127_1]|uniref:hypothetical protein n=1 Tax=unclassified Pseudoalteromonas TaxID=194690 RepID=UPI0013FD7DD9|nr:MULTISPECIES: hypothetical protein [unclassified Pseudoalteromonas]MBG9996012.1 hypothetical protein [Pseudoalteromonas sp. NZS127_1]MBH0013014.1 hypothetical protein [Pseudoalteromonas sp. NZS100_1]MBH0043441.1 hypothetical protein [Pseudoalteromonas sp. SWXJZ10B]MBH0051472.1 hypothetical protein [Pseudoalteromonas sp. SWYJZ19]MBH0076327.1 hypothetical protein [Pseudoalteromonas sp. SWYJ118]